MKRLKKGEKVKDRYGNVYTVRGQVGDTVYLEVHPSDKVTLQRAWIHRTKCFRLNARGEVEE